MYQYNCLDTGLITFTPQYQSSTSVNDEMSLDSNENNSLATPT
jgi:hypothetical protein